MTFQGIVDYGTKSAMLTATLHNMTEHSPYHFTSLQIKEEEKLIIAAQLNPRDFEPLYKNYYERIANFIYSRLNDKEMTFELTSQVFYKALDNLPKYKPQGVPFSAWLFRIASNELNQFFRKNNAQRHISINEDGLQELRANTEENNTPKQDESLFKALEELDEDDAELINMRFFEKRSFKEICDINGMNESACKMKLYRILEKLKVKLKDIVR